MESLNVWMRRAGGLEILLWELQQGNVDVCFLQETKLTQGIHAVMARGKCMGDRGTYSASGGSSGVLASGRGMAGGEHNHLWP